MNIFIIHSYNADTKESFWPYVVDKATELGFNVIFPDFPIEEKANYQKWAEIMDKYLASGELNADSAIVAHSLGTHFTPRYLAERNIPIKLFISVAGFIGYVGRPELEKVAAEFALDDEKTAKAAGLIENRYALYSDNDPLNPQEKMEYYADKLNAERILIPGAGHFSPRAGVKEVPEIINTIKKVYGRKK